MSISVETAVVSRKGAARDFNTDYVNVSGKLWPKDVVNGEKGVRAAGTGSDRPYYVLASSDKKGTAESAASLFRSCVEKFSEDGSNDAVLIADYLKAFAKVLNETGFSSSDCDFSILTGVDDTVYIATAGGNKAYTFYDDTFIEIVPQQIGFSDNKSSFGVAQCSNVKAGDIFILLSGKTVSSLPAGLLEAVCKNAAGDVKKIVSLIASQAAKYGCKEAVSAIVIKITEAEPSAAKAPAEVPAAAASAHAAAEEITEEDADKTEQHAEEQPEEEGGEEETAPVSKGKKAGRLFLILLLACAVIAGVLFGIKYWSESHGDPGDSTVDPSSVSASVSVSESQNAAAQTSTTQKPSETSTTEVSTTAESTTEAPTTEKATSAPTRANYPEEDETEEEPATVPTTEREEEPTEGSTDAEESTEPTSSQEPETGDVSTENQGGEEGSEEGGDED